MMGAKQLSLEIKTISVKRLGDERALIIFPQRISH